MSERFRDRVAIVTGAGSGIGRSITHNLVKEGARVLAVDVDRDAIDATRATAEVQERVSSFVCDVAAPGMAQKAAEAASEMGPIQLLAAAAGVLDRQSFLEAGDETWHRLLDVNVKAYAAFTREAAAKMRDHGQGGSVALVASITGHISSPLVTYSTTKAAVIGMVRSVAPELAQHGIRINSVSPGVVRTGMNCERLADAEAVRREAEVVPIGRVGDPSEIAAATLFLLSDDARYVTGTDLIVDGGFQHYRPGPPAGLAPARTGKGGAST